MRARFHFRLSNPSGWQSELEMRDEALAAYRRYLFAVIVGVMMLNTVDRHVVAILVDPIKADLGLSDSEMGWILGPSFTLVYTLAVLPLARWADRGVRQPDGLRSRDRDR